MSFELKIVHYLVHHPQIAKTVTIDPAWFGVRSCREFVQFLLAHPGPYPNWVALQRRFQAAYPTAFADNEWHQLSQPVNDEKLFTESLQTLQFWYVQGNAQAAAQAYFALPSAENLAQLQQVSAQLSALNQPQFPTLSLATHGKAMLQALEKPQPSGIRTFNVVSFLYPASNMQNHQVNRHLNLIFRKNRSGRLAELAFLFKPRQMRFTPQIVTQD